MLITNTPTGQQLSGIKFGIFEYEFGLNYTKKSENEKIYFLILSGFFYVARLDVISFFCSSFIRINDKDKHPPSRSHLSFDFDERD